MSVVVIVTPVLCCFMLWISQGWIPPVVYLVAQVLLFGLYFLERFINRKFKKLPDFEYNELGQDQFIMTVD